MSIKRIVVLDDDPDYLNILSGFAQVIGVGFEGHLSFTSLEINSLSNDDILLLDIFMPDKDALDIILELANTATDAYLGVVSGADEEVISSVNATANQLNINFLGALHKPLRISNLSELIDKANNTEIKRYNPQKVMEKFNLQNLFEELAVEHWFEQGYVFPVFQPQYDIESKTITGIECLTRVRHPKTGIINPFEFISMMESYGRINTYTLYFIDQALQTIQAHLKQREFLTCSFNISAQNLDKAFADELVNLFKRFQVKPEQITLEITESRAIKMKAEALYAISRLKLFGVKLAIDDFGTGYSSISQLVDLPFDEIKIDRSFICQLENNPKAQAIVSATFNLASSLNFNLVVEGVETYPQLEALQKQGACVIQGYLFSKPVNEPELSALLAAPSSPSEKVVLTAL